jgi:hypothetical protein
MAPKANDDAKKYCLNKSHIRLFQSCNRDIQMQKFFMEKIATGRGNAKLF